MRTAACVSFLFSTVVLGASLSCGSGIPAINTYFFCLLSLFWAWLWVAKGTCTFKRLRAVASVSSPSCSSHPPMRFTLENAPALLMGVRERARSVH
jgi:hypothetical protein